MKIRCMICLTAGVVLSACGSNTVQDSFSIDYVNNRAFRSYYASGDNGNTVVNVISSYTAEVLDNGTLAAEERYDCSAFYYKLNTGARDWQYLFSLVHDDAGSNTVVKRETDSVFVACGDSLYIMTFGGLVHTDVFDSLVYPGSVPYTMFTSSDTGAILQLNEDNNWYKTFDVWKAGIDSVYGD